MTQVLTDLLVSIQILSLVTSFRQKSAQLDVV